ncbi:forkhead-associated protein (plasmid) [Scytonema sp. HK-05]|nr:forkhead-associated protein [Scytonema sp. HK-05]
MMKVRVLNAETLGKINEVNLDLVPNENNEYIIGRSPKSGLVLDSLDVSRQHGKFFLHDGNYSYSDLGSINGSLVNDKLAEPNEVYMLKSGDVVRIGEFLLVMEEINQNSEEPEALAATVLNMDWQAAMAAIKDRAVKPENEVSRIMAEDPNGVNEVAKPFVTEVPQLLVQQSGESTYIQPPEKAESSEPNVETSAVDKDQAVIPAVDTQLLLHEGDISQSASHVSEDETPVSGATTETPEILDQEDWEEDEQQQEESTPVVNVQSPLDEDETDEDEDDIPQSASDVLQQQTPVSGATTETPEILDQEDWEEDEQQQEESTPVVNVQSPLDEDETDEDEDDIPQSASDVLQQQTPVSGATTETPEILDQEDWEEDEQQQEESTPVVNVQSPLDEDETDEDEDDISQPASHVSQQQTPVSGATTETPEILDQKDWEEDEQQQEQSTPVVGTQSPLNEDETHEDEDDIPQPASHVSQQQTPVSTATTKTPEILDQEDWEEDEQQQEESTPVVNFQSPLNEDETHEDETDEDETDEDETNENDISQPASHISKVEDEVDENPNPAVNTQLSLDENKVFEETNIETQAVENLDAIANTLEETEKTSQEEEVENSQITINTDIKEASEEVAMFEDTSQEPQETEVSDTSNQTPELPSQALEILSKKYIALMAHDTKKSDLVDFVTQHKDFLSKCLTIATPSVSETLFLKTGFATSQKTASVPAGGHQAVASLIGSGDILAVILLKDVLPVQSQANEDALLRLCNANQVLVATNLPTAEAILLYVKNKITSF